MNRLRWTLYLLLAAWSTAFAHEFWIEPSSFTVPESERIVADLRVGQYFKGNSQVYLPNTFVSFTVTDSAGTRSVDGRIGDLPAGKIPTRRTGLHVLAYHSEPSSTTYSTFSDFEHFARKQDIDWVIEAHRRRELPEKGITEAFTRYAKSLVQVGDGSGHDLALGMPFELVAETNPYSDPTVDAVIVRLLLDSAPRPDTQVTVFRKLPGCEATRSTVQTDAAGRARIPAGSGGRFLVNAVHLQEPPQDGDTMWESLWASLTFELPERSPGKEAGQCDPAAGDPEEDVR
jgi:hypothetical protein